MVKKFQMVKQIELEEYWKSIQYQVMGEKSRESDLEIHFKDTFRAFSKDNDGNFGNNVLGKSRKKESFKRVNLNVFSSDMML